MPATDAQIWATNDALGAVQGQISKTAFKKQQTALGISYSADGVLSNVALRDFFFPTLHIFFDVAHCFLSNGLAQWVLWSLMDKMEDVTNLSWNDMNELLSMNWHIPASHGKTASPSMLRNLLSDERIKASKASEAHVYKGGISDILLLLPITLYFVETVLQQIPAMAAACESFICLCRIVERIFAPGCAWDWAHGRATVETLQELLKKNFEKYFAAFDVDSTKPKWHYSLHIARRP